MRHETAIFGQKNPKSRNSSYHFFFLPFLLFQQQKNTKISRNTYFYSVLANLKKRIFKFKLKTQKIKKKKKLFLHPFFEKGYF